MIPVLLILPTPPVVGKVYHLKPVIGDGLVERTAVYRGQIAREEEITYTRRGGERVTYRYTYDLGEFADADTGEIIYREIEVTDAIPA